MSIWGYCRISRKQQNIERQIRNIKREYPKAVIVEEVYSGTKVDRPEWVRLHKNLKEGDTIVFDSVSRMSRNAEEGFVMYEELFNRGINLVFLKEHHIDSETYKRATERNIGLTGTNVDYIIDGINKYMLALAKEQIKLAFEQAEKEVEDLHQRTREGIETARLNGKQIGQKTGAKLITKKSIEMKDKIKKMARDFNENMTDAEVIQTLKLARNTYYKYKRELQEESYPFRCDRPDDQCSVTV